VLYAARHAALQAVDEHDRAARLGYDTNKAEDARVRGAVSRRVYALIPARGGSKRIQRKNLQKVGGFTLVARAVMTAQASSFVDRIYVSTEDTDIALEALRVQAQIIPRPAELAQDDTPMESVVDDFLAQLDVEPDIVVLLEPTAPLRLATDIDLAVAMLLAHPRVPAVRLVSPDFSEMDEHGMTKGCHPATYRDAGLASAVRVNALGRGCLFPGGTVLIEHGDGRSVDVDEPADLERVRALAEPG
jgi:CMP-N-acetylneuraminic acid synthetase